MNEGRHSHEKVKKAKKVSVLSQSGSNELLTHNNYLSIKYPGFMRLALLSNIFFNE